MRPRRYGPEDDVNPVHGRVFTRSDLVDFSGFNENTAKSIIRQNLPTLSGSDASSGHYSALDVFAMRCLYLLTRNYGMLPSHVQDAASFLAYQCNTMFVVALGVRPERTGDSIIWNPVDGWYSVLNPCNPDIEGTGWHGEACLAHKLPSVNVGDEGSFLAISHRWLFSHCVFPVFESLEQRFRTKLPLRFPGNAYWKPLRLVEYYEKETLRIESLRLEPATPEMWALFKSMPHRYEPKEIQR